MGAGARLQIGPGGREAEGVLEALLEWLADVVADVVVQCGD